MKFLKFRRGIVKRKLHQKHLALRRNFGQINMFIPEYLSSIYEYETFSAKLLYKRRIVKKPDLSFAFTGKGISQ
jgi:hypothetical protein